VVSGAIPQSWGWDLQHVDLQGKDLSGMHLVACNLKGAQLQQTDLTGAFLNRANLRGANLRKATLRGASIWNADLSECDLTHACLDGANLAGSHLEQADLTGADISNADMRDSCFRKAVLRYARAVNSDMYGADFSGGDLTGACFDQADISLIQLDGARTSGLSVQHCTPKKKYIVPLCRRCMRGRNPAEWYHYENEFRHLGLRIGDRIDTCTSCGASIRYGDLRVEVVGTDGKEVAKVIDKVRTLNRQTSAIQVTRYDVFLSYDSTDETVASDVYARLTARGLKCFYAPISIPAGTLWENELQEAASASKMAVVVLTETSITSKWVLVEIGAFWAANKPLIAASKGVTADRIPEALSKYQLVKITTDHDMERLCEHVERLCKKERKKHWWFW
jgi:uncharacterized protein YjbI with pentapeptide repeats